MVQDSKPELNVKCKKTIPERATHRRVSTQQKATIPKNPQMRRCLAPCELWVRSPLQNSKSYLMIEHPQKFIQKNSRKTIARKAPELRGTLKPQSNILENGTITKYTPHTITQDTYIQKNTVIQKCNRDTKKTITLTTNIPT